MRRHHERRRGWPAGGPRHHQPVCTRQKGEKNLMNDRENDTMRENEGRQVQQELEDQLRAFGDTVSDAFAHGFEGKGEGHWRPRLWCGPWRR